MKSYNGCPFLPGLLHFSIMFSRFIYAVACVRMLLIFKAEKLSIVRVYHGCFFIHLLMGIWVASTLWLLWSLMLLWTVLYKYLSPRFQFFWVHTYPGNCWITWKVGVKLNIQKTKIMASGPITWWEIDGETVETVSDFIFLGSKITADGDCSHEIKRRLLLGRKVMAPGPQREKK